MKINTIIIGLGKIGFKYNKKNKSDYVLNHFDAFDSNINFNISAVCDLKNNYQNYFKKKKIPFFNDYKKALELHDPELVIISTPTSSHYNILKTLIKKSNVKAILCEKPFTKNLYQASHIVSKKKIFINYMRSCDLEFENKVTKKIKKKNLLIDVFYKGTILNSACHYIHLLNKYFKNCKKIKNVKKYRSGLFDFELHYNNNIVARFTSSSYRKLNLNGIRFMSNNKVINYENGGHQIYTFKNSINPIYKINGYLKLEKISINEFYENSQKYVVKNILNFFRKKKYSLCTAKEAVYVHKLLHEIIND